MPAMARRLMVLLAMAVIGIPACRRVSQRTLGDTEGRSFSAECDRDGSCKLKRVTGESASTDKSELSLYSPGRMVAICDVAPGAEPAAASDCRVLTCKQDGDCPPGHGIKDGACINGLCTEPSHDLIADDAVMLCLAGTGLGRSAPNQVARYAMALNCGSPCRVPAPCRQP